MIRDTNFCLSTLDISSVLLVVNTQHNLVTSGQKVHRLVHFQTQLAEIINLDHNVPSVLFKLACSKIKLMSDCYVRVFTFYSPNLLPGSG